MTREQYIALRMQNSPLIIYEYYKENIGKHSLLPPEVFFQLFQMWTNINVMLEKVCSYYNNTFQIVQLLNKNGELIKLL